MSLAPVALITGGARRIGAEIACTLHAAGFNIAIHPVMASQAVAQTLTDVYGQFADTENHNVSHMTFETLTKTVGFQEVWDLDEKSATTRSPASRP